MGEGAGYFQTCEVRTADRTMRMVRGADPTNTRISEELLRATSLVPAVRKEDQGRRGANPAGLDRTRSDVPRPSEIALQSRHRQARAHPQASEIHRPLMVVVALPACRSGALPDRISRAV